MKFIITILFVLSCIHTLSRYSMTNTALGNTGWNTKPIYTFYFEKVKGIFKDINKDLLYRNSDDVRKSVTDYAIKNIDRIKKIIYWMSKKVYIIENDMKNTERVQIFRKYLMQIYNIIPINL